MKIIKLIFSRLTFMIIAAACEIMLIAVLFRWFREQAGWITEVLHALSVIIILMVIKNSRHLSSDLFWVVLIALFPAPGTAVWLLLGTDLVMSKTYKNIKASTASAEKYYRQDPEVMKEMIEKDPALAGQFRYISQEAGFPFYRNTGFSYYPLGELGHPVMLEELKKAEKFIFVEYFIIEEGQMWDSMHEILKEKAQQGVDVRVLYDDLGSFQTLSMRYAETLESEGIKCIPFNRINPLLGSIMNHRDHRKIMVIDGKTAFSGGVNLADEYINTKVICGHWKDNIIKVTGEAVWSYTVMFLTHWNALRQEDSDFEVFRAQPIEGEHDGYIAPYGETPLDDEITAQNIYIGMLNQSTKYCYIMTPYLIIDTELINALILAAGHGVDVKIITPGVPDKKFVWQVTRSYYRTLIHGGVKIYEYTPGFIHAKVFVSDDKAAAVGTVNLDYRSLYLHFENGTYLYGSEKVKEVRDDVLQTLEKCHEVTAEECRGGFISELGLSILRLIAPMM